VSHVFAKNRKIAQAFAILLPMGSEEKPMSVVIRAIVTNDFMTGRPAKIGEEFAAAELRDLVDKIVHEFPQIDCVAYDFTTKPPATVEWM
jgi:GMP synthase (glutamine-hydrolysing)